MNNLFEKYDTLLEMKRFIEHYHVGTHNGWEVYYNVGGKGRYDNHIERRMDSNKKKVVNGNDMGYMYGGNFCTMEEFYEKIKNFVDQLTDPNSFNTQAVQKFNTALKQSRDNVVKLLFDFKDQDSMKKVPVIIAWDAEDKAIFIGSLYGVGISYKTIEYKATIRLKEQYNILKTIKSLFD